MSKRSSSTRRSRAASNRNKRHTHKLSNKLWLLLALASVCSFTLFSFAVFYHFSDSVDEAPIGNRKTIELYPSVASRAARHWSNIDMNERHSDPVAAAAAPKRSALKPPQQGVQPSAASYSVIRSVSECKRSPSHNSIIDITLVTQASADRMWMIPQICQRWGGPMIVATLSQQDSTKLEQNDPSIPMGNASGCRLRLLRLMKPNLNVTDKQSWYPINWLRNAGISCVNTSHYFVVDVDFWPSIQLRSALREKLTRLDDLTALVVPNFQRNGHGCRNADDPTACKKAFERGEIEMPSTFSSLQGCIDARDCVVFDGEYNPQGQASTDVKAWLKLPPGATHVIPCITSERYEPFVALKRTETTPTFDESFTGYGKNKVQLIVHLRRAGFGFEVLSQGFVLHFPHQRSASKHHWLHSSAQRRIDKLFVAFCRQVASRYANIAPRTPLCSEHRQQQQEYQQHSKKTPPRQQDEYQQQPLADDSQSKPHAGPVKSIGERRTSSRADHRSVLQRLAEERQRRQATSTHSEQEDLRD